MNITESIKFNKLKEENEALNSKIRALKEEITELNKMIEDLITINEVRKAELDELKQQILYKEDFDAQYLL
uniref:Uncharacterized protein n=1 Tax=Spiroplasma citri TaxID=2133 RepID=Q14LQ4_SPICI|nr:hypothetical protein c-terminal truncated [Spiroplasma citri]